MKTIVINQSKERQVYVPASMKVINFTAHKLMCVSGDGTQEYDEQDADDMFLN